MDDNYKEVDFENYCKTCKYSKNEEEKDPCDECLSIPCRQYSRKPINYKKES